jgi:hypothetical protein
MMRFAMMCAVGIVFAQAASAQWSVRKELVGSYRGLMGTVVLQESGSARLPKDVYDGPADGFKWTADEDVVRVIPYVYQGPRELNQILDMPWLFFSISFDGAVPVLTRDDIAYGELVFRKL